MRKLFLLCVLCVFVVNLTAQEKPAPELTQAEREELSGLTTSFQAVAEQMAAIEAEHRALSKIRVDLAKKLEDFAQRAVNARSHKQGEAHLDLNAKRVVKSEPKAVAKP